MEAHFHQSQRIAKEALQLLYRRSSRVAVPKFLFMYMAFLGTATAIVLTWNGPWWWQLLSQIGFGLVGCSQFAALHESGHGTAFRSRNANRLAATLAGVAHCYPASIFRALHFTHHRHTHIPGLDPEISLGHKPVPSVINQPPMYLGWLSGLPLLLFKLVMALNGALGMPSFVRKKLYPFIKPGMRREIALESWLVILVWGGITWLAIEVHPGFWGLWVGQVLSHMMLASYLVVEHNGLPHEGDILEKTRSIVVPVWVRSLMWNMPYHAEHHAYPAVPFHALPELHEALKPELKHAHESHPVFHSRVIKAFFKRRTAS